MIFTDECMPMHT